MGEVMKSRNFRSISIFAGLLLLAAAAFIGGCSSSSNSSTSGGGSGDGLEVTNINVNPSSVEVGSASIIEATIHDGGTASSGKVVYFTCTPSSAGFFTPAVDTSDTAGEVGTIFTPLDDGNVSISIAVDGGTNGTALLVATAGSGGATGGSGNITINVTPALVQADGISTAQLAITVRDGAGNVAPDSTLVRLVAGEQFVDNDGNGYWTAGTDSLVSDNNNNGQWDAIGSIPSTAYVTGGSGQVTVNYTAGTQSGSIYVRATVEAGSSYSGYGMVSIQLTPNANIASFFLGSRDQHIAVKRTGGDETTTLYAIGYDAYGNPVPEGVQVNFIITDGPDNTDDGEHLGSLTGASRRGPYTTTTNGSGIAECPLSSGTVSGTIRIRAYADTVLSNAAHVMVHAGPPANIYVAAKECNVPYWDFVGRDQEVVAIVTDVYNNPVGDSTVVYFSCDEGSIIAHLDRIDDENGIAETKWYSTGNGTTNGQDGIVWIHAETAGGTVQDSSYFINSGVPASITFVAPFPSSVYADGKTMEFFDMVVLDGNTNFVADETEIDLEAKYLAVAGAFAKDGCHFSIARTFYTSVVLDYDHSMNGVRDDSIGAVDNISSSYKGFFTVTQPCTLWTGPAYSKECQVDVPASVSSGATVPFSATIKDRWGNVLGDHVLTATATAGSIAGSPSRSDIYGEATGFTFTAPPAADSVTSVIISITDTDPAGGITFNESVTINLE